MFSDQAFHFDYRLENKIISVNSIENGRTKRTNRLGTIRLLCSSQTNQSHSRSETTAANAAAISGPLPRVYVSEIAIKSGLAKLLLKTSCTIGESSVVTLLQRLSFLLICNQNKSPLKNPNRDVVIILL